MSKENKIYFCTELSIEELKDRWEYLFWELGVDTLKITEEFTKSKRTYEVSGLNMEIEDDRVMCTDADNILMNYYSVLMMFIRKRCTKISLIPTKSITGYYEELIFGNDGKIIIEAI